MWAVIRDMSRGALLLVVGVFLLIAVLLVGTFAFGWFSRETAEFRGSTAQTEQVQADPNFRIASYERFFNLCAAVQAKEAGIKEQEALLESASTPARREQLQTNLAALRTTRVQDIARYNADAAKTDTRGNFLASNLPYNLDPNAEATTCAS